MAEVQVRNLENEVVGTLELADEVFSYHASPTLVWEAVTAFLAGRRKGTHSTKTRGEVSGSGRKLWRQKGTGRARIGSIRSPLWRKGGTVHGPKPRDYAWALPKRKRRHAVCAVLTDRLENGALWVFESLDLPSHKTKDFAAWLKSLGLDGKVLLVEGKENRNLYLGSRNVPGVTLPPSNGVSVYDLVRHDTVVVSRRAILELQEVLKR
ncbi:MAG TPA: 50S ribosomal protein L4 [Acidobacteriota bacterium]|nr:50S ribosomal protein L4 [Acidobacteriota bacterium]